jgi:hypothetical protein
VAVEVLLGLEEAEVLEDIEHLIILKLQAVVVHQNLL